MIKKYFALSIIAASVAIAGCSDDDDDDDTDSGPMQPTVPQVPAATPGEGSSAFDTIFNSADHSTLAGAIAGAGLDDALDNPESEFTIFAPTNDAFQALIDADDEDAFSAPEDFADTANSVAVARILNYHVSAGTITSTELSTRLTDGDEATNSVPTLLTGQSLTIAESDATSGLAIVDSVPTTVALDAVDLGLPEDATADTTGVVHSIDTVLTPPAADPGTTPEPGGPTPNGASDTALADDGNYEIARAAISEFFAGSLDREVWTFFLPSDTILGEAGVTELTAAQLQSHIHTDAAITPAMLAGMSEVKSSNNNNYPVTSEGGVTSVNGFEATLLTDVSVSNAQVYAIGGILTAAAAE